MTIPQLPSDPWLKNKTVHTTMMLAKKKKKKEWQKVPSTGGRSSTISFKLLPLLNTRTVCHSLSFRFWPAKIVSGPLPVGQSRQWLTHMHTLPCPHIQPRTHTQAREAERKEINIIIEITTCSRTETETVSTHYQDFYYLCSTIRQWAEFIFCEVLYRRDQLSC